MFFVLSKVLQSLTVPFVTIAVLLVVTAFTKNEKRKKILFRASLILLLFFSNDFLASKAMRFWEVQPTPYQSITKHYKVGVLLSGFTVYDKEYPDRIFLTLDRVTHSLHLYKTGVIDKFLISGGRGKIQSVDPPEAEQIEQVLLLMGVKKEDIITENNSRNTHESAVEVAKLLLPQYKPEDLILITSGNHMRRSLACFKKVGLSIDHFSSDILAHEEKLTIEKLVVPTTHALWKWQVLSKEIIGCVMYKIVGYI